MEKKEVLALALLTSLCFFLLTEVSYVMNISSFTFQRSFSMIPSMAIRYAINFLVVYLCFFLIGLAFFQSKAFLKRFRHYVIFGSVFFVFLNMLMALFTSQLETIHLQSEISLYCNLIFTSCFYFYSMYYATNRKI